MTSRKPREWPQTWPFYPFLEGEIFKTQNPGTRLFHQIFWKNFCWGAFTNIFCPFSNGPYRDTHGSPKVSSKWQYSIDYCNHKKVSHRFLNCPWSFSTISRVNRLKYGNMKYPILIKPWHTLQKDIKRLFLIFLSCLDKSFYCSSSW